MSVTKQRVQRRIYKCQACGFEQEQETNHTYNTYSWGTYSTCPNTKCPSFRNQTTWEYVGEIGWNLPLEEESR